jgi:small GTP-binding protein
MDNHLNEDFEHKAEDEKIISKEDFDFIKRFSVSNEIITKAVQNIQNKNKEDDEENNSKGNSSDEENIKEFSPQNNNNNIQLEQNSTNKLLFEKIFNSKEDCNLQFRLCLIGDANVGKTSLLNRYCENIYKENQENTIGVDFNSLTLKNKDNNMKIKLQIWDTAGQERFKSLNVNYFKSAHAFIYVYDITKKNSFKNLESFIDLVNSNNKNSACSLIIGNKKDLDNLREISLKEGKDFAYSKNFEFMEISTKNNINIDEAFNNFTIKIMEYYNVKSDQREIIEKNYIDSKNDIEKGNQKIKLEESKKKKNKNCKC